MKEVYIIEKNGNCIFYKIPKAPEDKNFDDDPYNHEYWYRKYIKDNNIELDDYNLTSYLFAEELAKKDISSIILENKTMCIFLPKNISKEQLDWYINRKNSLRHYYISYEYYDGDEIKTRDPDIDSGEITLIKEFYKHLKGKIKEGEINEHRRTI